MYICVCVHMRAHVCVYVQRCTLFVRVLPCVCRYIPVWKSVNVCLYKYASMSVYRCICLDAYGVCVFPCAYLSFSISLCPLVPSGSHPTRPHPAWLSQCLHSTLSSSLPLS